MNGRSTRLRPETLALLRQRLAELDKARGQRLVTEALGPVVPPAPVVSAPVTTLSAVPDKVETKTGQLVLPSFGAQLGFLAGTKARAVVAKAPAAAKTSRKKIAPLVVWPDEIVVVDTETTGTNRYARLVEIGAVRLRQGVVVDTWQTLVHPEQRIPAEVIAVHGITDAMVRAAPTAADAIAAFLQWLGGTALVAHNAAFDRRIFQQEFARVGLASPGLPMYCSLRLARRAFPGLGRYGLGALAQHFQIVVTTAHRAVADCMTTARVLQQCYQRHPGGLGPLHGPAKML